MSLLFEALRGIFLFMTVFMILFLTAGEQVLDAAAMSQIYGVMMPAYMILIGLLIGYMLNLLARTGDETPDEDYRIGTTAYIQGLVIGIVLALLYIFLGV